jgi:hypothetical protein
MKRNPDWSGQMDFLLCGHGYHSLVPLGKEPTIWDTVLSKFKQKDHSFMGRDWLLVLCLISLFKKYGFAIEPFSLLRDHFRDVSFVSLNPKNSGLRPSNSL